MPRPKLSLTSWILLALLGGVLTGLFFGEVCSGLQFIGDIFIRLLQMTVLPYIFMSMIANIGALSLEQAKLLGRRILLVLLGLWAIALLLVFVLPLSLPSLESATFFSTSLLADPPEADFVSLFVPKNPFESLSTSVVPAVVLFCVAVGVALIAVPGKERLIEPMQLASKSLSRVASFMVRLTPFGIFAIAAAAAGTMSFEDLSRIQAYLLMHTACALLLTFGVIPLGLSILTPFSYRELMRALKDPLVAGFTTGNVFITLPMLTESVRDLYASRGLDAERGGQSVEVVLPIAFSFPNLGKLLALLFIPFAGWYSGQPMEMASYPVFLVSSLATFFGSTNVAIPFLLDQQQLPADMFQLFMLTGIVGMRFGAMAAIVHHFCLGLLVSGQEQDIVGLRLRKLVPLLAVSAGVVLVIVVGLRAYLATSVKDAYDKDRVLESMRLLRPELAGVATQGPAHPRENALAGENRLATILRTKTLRVGYREDRLPWAFRNRAGELVGLDIEMAYRLASELDVALELVSFEAGEGARRLNAGDFDLIMSGSPITTSTAAQSEFTQPYMQATLGVACRDHARKRWGTAEAIQKIRSATIAVAGNEAYFTRRIETLFPNLEIVSLDSTRSFYEGAHPEIEALVMSAEAASAWSLLYPAFTVVVPKPHPVRIPVAYPLAPGEPRLRQFLDHWLQAKIDDGTVRQLRDHWIFGISASSRKPRWCIARDVLGWMD